MVPRPTEPASWGRPGSCRTIEADLVPIREALEVAFAVARRDNQDPTAPPPPRALSAILGFAHLPDRALSVVRGALDGDRGFRARVIEQSDVAAMDEGSRLFLERPEGWQQALGPLVMEASEQARADDLAARNAEVTQELQALSEHLDEVRSQRDRLGASVAGLERSGADQAERIGELEGRLSDVLDELEEREAQRREAVRQLKVQEALADRRLARQRELEGLLDQRVDGTTGDGPEDRRREPEGEPPDPEPGEPGPAATPEGATSHEQAIGQGLQLSEGEAQLIATSMGEAAGKLTELAAILGDLAEVVGSASPRTSAMEADPGGRVAGSRVPGAQRGGPADAGSAGTAPRQPVSAGVAGLRGDPPAVERRRRAVRLGRGLRVDSPDGLDALMRIPGTIAMVDGYNVSMKGWPALGVSQQRESLITSVAALEVRSSATFHLVFDGAEDGARPAVGAPLPVRVHFTPSDVEADDRLLEFVEQAPADAPVVVVSSDNRVREGARERGANVVSSETLLAVLRRS